MKKSIFILAIMLMCVSIAMAQISKRDSSIIAWAKGVEVYRGSQTADLINGVPVTYGSAQDAMGVADTFNLRCVSLGNGGSAIVTFDRPIINGNGADFVVYENGFNDSFLELAFVDVSSDGEHFFRFSNHSTATQTDMASSNYTGLAGKYDYRYGDGFDLSDLPDDANLDKYAVRIVRIVDVVSGVSTDSEGNIIYDPVTNNTYSAGFDLAGIAIINGGEPYKIADYENNEGYLTAGNTYNILSLTNYDDTVYDDNLSMTKYYKHYVSDSLDMIGAGYYMEAYSWFMALGYGVSNISDTLTGSGPSGTSYSYYYPASVSGLEGENSNYAFGYYSSGDSWIEHCAVYMVDSSLYYPSGVYVNQSYAAWEWDNNSFTDTSYLKIIATGYDAQDNITAIKEFYLADMRSSNNMRPLGNRTDWRWMDLKSLGQVKKITFSLESTDIGNGGMNTPAYYCMDNFVYSTNPLTGITPVTITETICENEVFVFRGDTLHTSGSYFYNDTIINLIVNDTSLTTIVVDITAGETYEFYGQTYNTAGIYTHIDTAANGCDSTVVLDLRISNSIKDAEAIIVNLYPNPAEDYVNIEAAKGSIIKIWDAMGRVVRSFETKDEISVIRNLEKGTYIINVSTKDKIVTKKLIIG